MYEDDGDWIECRMCELLMLCFGVVMYMIEYGEIVVV